jgi:pimeloyl-ACP methyl ester carboxylesterase
MRRPVRPLALLALATAVALVACGQHPKKYSPASLSGASTVTFTTSDGVELSGRLFGDAGAKTGIVMTHGLTIDQSSWFGFAPELAAKGGYQVLTYDQRGYCPGGDAGCSKGAKDPDLAWQDVEAAVAYLKTQGAEQVALVGSSMGGTASLVAASKLGDQVTTVVSMAAVSSVGALAATPDVIRGISAPVLFMAGSGDRGPAADAQAFYDESGPPNTLTFLDTTDHGSAMLYGDAAADARATVTDWLAGHLS